MPQAEGKRERTLGVGTRHWEWDKALEEGMGHWEWEA